MIERLTIKYEITEVESSRFTGTDGAAEYHVMIHPPVGLSFAEQYDYARFALTDFIKTKAAGAKPVFIRLFLSDIANQQEVINKEEFPCPVSVIGQPPLDGAKVTIWAWLAEKAEVHKSDEGSWTTEFGGARHLWSTGLSIAEGDSENQIREMLERYSDILSAHGCSLKGNCMRTWLYVNEIDSDYKGVAKGRREFFMEAGLTPQTHYIASTGIAGRIADPESRVIMDAYAVENISEKQIHYLKGSSHLNPTHEYGVTFERGTAVDHIDRRHVFISGTASINNRGEIVHHGDLMGQTLRMIENVGVLLDEAGCTYDDVTMMMVYLRDISDYEDIYDIMMERFPEHPKVFLWAPVCRPGWLVEMECMAVR